MTKISSKWQHFSDVTNQRSGSPLSAIPATEATGTRPAAGRSADSQTYPGSAATHSPPDCPAVLPAGYCRVVTLKINTIYPNSISIPLKTESCHNVIIDCVVTSSRESTGRSTGTPSVKLVGRLPGTRWLKSLWAPKRVGGLNSTFFQYLEKGGLNSIFFQSRKSGGQNRGDYLPSSLKLLVFNDLMHSWMFWARWCSACLCTCKSV